MIKTESKTASAAVKDILLWNPDRLNEVIRAVMQRCSRPRWTRRWVLRRASARRSVSAITRATTGGELAAHLLPFDNPKFQSLYSS